jgi:hypothetical protein
MDNYNASYEFCHSQNLAFSQRLDAHGRSLCAQAQALHPGN